MSGRTFPSENAEATRALGAALGRLLQPGDFLCLLGDLGAGKTTFTQGLATGLGLPAEYPVPSPTFTLLTEHLEGRIPLYHFDVYRLADAGGLYDLAFDEYLDGDGVIVMEWADRVQEALPGDRLEIRLSYGEDIDHRRIALAAYGARSTERMLRLEETLR